jgi:hypothetical protein
LILSPRGGGGRTPTNKTREMTGIKVENSVKAIAR